MILKKITVKISPDQIFTIFVLEMRDKFNKFILEGWKCLCWMAIDNTNNERFGVFLLSDFILFLKNDVHIRSEPCFG